MKFNNMRQLIIILVCIFLTQIHTKKVSKKITALDLVQGAQTIFITRFDFGIGSGNITLRYKKLYETNTLFQNIKVGLLIDQNYTKFKQVTSCEQKQKLYKQIHKIRFYDSSHGTQFIRIQQTVREHLWFIYAYTCDKLQIDYKNKDQKQAMNFQLTLLNNGSQLGQDQNLLWPFCGILILWLVLLIVLLIPVVKSMNQKPSWAEVGLYIGYLVLGLGLTITYLNGDIIYIFDALHAGCKTLVQGIMVTILVSISWGWSLIHLRYHTRYIFAAIFVTILNVIAIIIWHASQEDEQSYHQYQGYTGTIVMVIRLVICVIFVWGCQTIKGESVGKRKYFIQKFSRLGLGYLCAWPLAVSFAQLFLPEYLHNQMIHIIEETVHLFMNAYMCYLFANPDSDYQKINLKDQDEGANRSYLPEYVRKK